jgi:hypothetical protein
VRRALAAQPLLVVRLGRLTPADIGLVAALRGQHRLLVGGWTGSRRLDGLRLDGSRRLDGLRLDGSRRLDRLL